MVITQSESGLTEFDVEWPHYEAPSVELPPPEVWLIDPKKEKLETPVDDRGLIDVAALVETVKKTIDPEYQWSRRVSVHHFYWPEADYVYYQEKGISPATFRGLPVNKGLVPRVFENWVHAITLPVTMPGEEVMHYYAESWLVARQLFMNARQVIRWERRARRRIAHLQDHPDILPEDFQGEDKIGTEVILGILTKHFRGVDYQLSKLERIPKEFRFIEPDDLWRANKLSSERMAHLGNLVVPKSRKLINAIAA